MKKIKNKEEIILEILKRYPSDWWDADEITIKAPFGRRMVYEVLNTLTEKGELRRRTVDGKREWKINE